MAAVKEFPLENIIHRTGASPFSIHQTILDPLETCALYLHCHPEAELFLLDEGEVLFHIENHSFSLQAGDGIFIPPNLIHWADRNSEPKSSCSYRAIVFSIELLEQFFSSHKQYFAPIYYNRLQCIYPIFCSNRTNETLLHCIKQMLSHHNQALETYELAMSGLLLLCWQELYNVCFSQLTPPSNTDNIQTHIQKSLDYIFLHYNEALSLSTLAKEAGFSESYFCHSFKEFTGYSPFEYLNRVRIANSCELLTQTNKKITEIALLCGFNNISYFNRIFYRLIGHSPSDYRKETLNKPS